MEKRKIFRNLTILIVVFLSCCADLGRSQENDPKFECKIHHTSQLFYDLLEEGVAYCEASNWIFNEANLEASKVVHLNGTELEKWEETKNLIIFNANVKFGTIPNGIKKKFPKLIHIGFNSCGLRYLDKENLRQFGSDLEYFGLVDNPLEVLNTDLFKYNPNLEIVIFYGCSLKFIYPEFFENLTNLKKLTKVVMENKGRNNGCVDQRFDSRWSNIETFEWNARKCTNSTIIFECKDFVSKRNDEEATFCNAFTSNFIFDDSNLEAIEVTHPNGTKIENWKEIDHLVIYHANMKFGIPNGIKRKFPELKMIAFFSCGLTYLDKENLKQFGSDLEYLLLNDNPIEVLDADLFEFNPNLEVVRINWCSLKFIDPGFFENLKNLKKMVVVDMQENGCIDRNFDSKRKRGDNIETFKWEAENCTDTTARDKNLKFRNEIRKTKVVNENLVI